MQDFKQYLNPLYKDLVSVANFSDIQSKDLSQVEKEEYPHLEKVTNNISKTIQWHLKRLDDLVKGIVVMTKGKDGVSVSNGKTLWKAKILKKKKVIDVTGAGDAFVSGFISVFVRQERINEKVIEEAIRIGIANASSVVGHIGTKPGILYKKDF